MPLVRYGPYRPFCTVISSPSSGWAPTTRGSESSRSASSSVTVSSDMSWNSDAVLGLAFFGASASSTSVTYGP